MAASSSSINNPQTGTGGARAGIVHILELIALFVLLMVIAMRPLITETHESALNSISRAISDSDNIGPATTAWFNLGIWLSAVLTSFSVVLGKRQWRWSGAEIGWLVMLFAAIVSTLYASNQRLAVNASCDWLTALVMIMVLVNLCSDRRRIVLVLAVIVASGAVSAAKCIMQISTEYAETREVYEHNKFEFWQKQGIPLDDSRVELYERRLNAREASGFIPHSNAQGGLLSLAGFGALAIGGLFSHRRAYQIIFLILALILFSTIYTTGSRMAMLSAAVGVCLWLLLRRIYDSLRRDWRKWLVVGWGLVIAGSLAVFAIGLVRGGLPGSSLNFRWNYWQVTNQIITDHVWSGVGALNFDHAYMAYKPIEYPEEISDPHNFLLAVISQWGILGGAGLILTFIGVSIVAARIWGQRGESDHTKPMPTESSGFAAMPWIMALVAGYVLVRVWVLRDYLSGGLAGQSFLFFDIGMYGVIWLFFVTGIIWLFSRYGSAESRDDKYRLACLCGILAFILQNTIDYSMFYSGTLTLFAATSAVLLARCQLPTPKQTASGSLICIFAVLGLIYFLSVMFIPVYRTESYLVRARSFESYNYVMRHYQQAAEADLIDPTPLAELAGGRLQQVQILHLNGTTMDRNTAVGQLTKALSELSSAIGRDHTQISLYRLQSWLFKTRFDLTQSKEDLLSAIDSARQVLNLYPVSPNGHLFLADMLAFGASSLDSADLASQASLHYQQALDQDSARPGTDEVRRWYAAKRQQIVEKLKALGQHTDKPISGPNSSNENQ